MTGVSTMLVRPRRLPRCRRPYPGETLQSYLGRLDRANGLPAGSLAEQRAASPLDSVEFVAAVTGIAQRALVFALPEVRSQRHLTSYPQLRGQPSTGCRSHACRWCAAGKGIAGVVAVWCTHERVLCARHRMWTGCTSMWSTDQVSVAALPEVLAAHRVHRRLISRWGREPVRRAFGDAVDIVAGWLSQRVLPACQVRLDRLLDDDSGAGWNGARTQAARYPSVVALTTVLVDPGWVARLRARDPAQWGDACRYVADTVTDGYRPSGVGDPLIRWSRDAVAVTASRPETVS